MDSNMFGAHSVCSLLCLEVISDYCGFIHTGVLKNMCGLVVSTKLSSFRF